MQRIQNYNERLATKDDLFELTILAKESYNTLDSKDTYTFNYKKVGALLENAVDDDRFLLVVLENDAELAGYFLGMIAESFFALEKQTACLSWFIRREHRSIRNARSLLRAFEKWGADNGSVTSNMTSIKKGQERAFNRLGYILAEEIYIKRI